MVLWCLCFVRVIKVDEFTRKLWDIYEAVNKEEILQVSEVGGMIIQTSEITHQTRGFT